MSWRSLILLICLVSLTGCQEIRESGEGYYLAPQKINPQE